MAFGLDSLQVLLRAINWAGVGGNGAETIVEMANQAEVAGASERVRVRENLHVQLFKIGQGWVLEAQWDSNDAEG